MVRLVLRKSALFGGALREQGPRMHAPLAPRGGARPGLILAPSKDNPAILRWQHLGSGETWEHDGDAHRLMDQAHDAGEAPVTRARADKLQHLEDQGYVRFHAEPEHHAYEFRAVLTDKGRTHVRERRRRYALSLQQAQSHLFMAKGRLVRLVMRKGVQMALFGGTPAHVHAHIAKDPGGHGVHMVRDHERHLAAAGHSAMVSPSKDAAMDKPPTPAPAKPPMPPVRQPPGKQEALMAEAATLLQTTTKNLPGRLYGMGYRETCGRCWGSGHHSRNYFGQTYCYGCNGRGEHAARLTPELLHEITSDVAAGKLTTYLEHRKEIASLEARAKGAEEEVRAVTSSARPYTYFYGTPDGSDKGEDKRLGSYDVNHHDLRFRYVNHTSASDALFDAVHLAKNAALRPEEREEVLRRITQYADAMRSHVALVTAHFDRSLASGLLEKRRLEHRDWTYQTKEIEGEKIRQRIPRGYLDEQAQKAVWAQEAAQDMADLPAVPTLDVKDIAELAKKRASTKPEPKPEPAPKEPKPEPKPEPAPKPVADPEANPRRGAFADSDVRQQIRALDHEHAKNHAKALAAAIAQAGGPQRINVWDNPAKGVRVYFPAGAGYLHVGHDGSISDKDGGRLVFNESALYAGWKKAYKQARETYRTGMKARLDAHDAERVRLVEAADAARGVK